MGSDGRAVSASCMCSPTRYVWFQMKLSFPMSWTFGVLFAFIFAGRGLAAPTDLQTGFFLLRHTCDEESKVELLDFVKTTPGDVADYLKRVSASAKELRGWIDSVEEREPGLKLEKSPLPQFEEDVRASIKADKQHNLLFGTKDVRYQRALLFAQTEATNYIMHMTKVLAKDDPGRASRLMKFSEKWHRLRDEAVKMSAGR